MKVFTHKQVEKFIKNLDSDFAVEVVSAIELLETYGHKLPLPHAKSIGGGLWELRILGKHSARILYGFNKKDIILLLAFKKNKTAILNKDLKTAKKRLEEYCDV